MQRGNNRLTALWVWSAHAQVSGWAAKLTLWRHSTARNWCLSWSQSAR